MTYVELYIRTLRARLDNHLFTRFCIDNEYPSVPTLNARGSCVARQRRCKYRTRACGHMYRERSKPHGLGDRMYMSQVPETLRPTSRKM